MKYRIKRGSGDAVYLYGFIPPPKSKKLIAKLNSHRIAAYVL